ncbi:hypothetical protein KW807_00490 [Candidatus Parcubacteria bacterium]|nr:hypothetical protein [Candidatus Parcubacteria bacterium]
MALPYGDDLPRHLENGKQVLGGNFDVLYKNVYSYTEPNQTFINHHWLYGVIIYPIFLISGWSGLSLFNILILLSAFSILFLTALKYAQFSVVALLSIPAVIILSERTGVRPEAFTYLFIAIFLFIFSKIEEKPHTNLLWWLIPLQVIWVNTHIFFFVGPALVGGYLLQQLIERKDSISRRLEWLLLAVVVACLLNPNGLSGALYPLNIFNSYGVKVSENVTIPNFIRGATYFADPAVAIFWPIATLLILGFVVLGYIYRKKKYQVSSFPSFYLLASLATILSSLLLLRAISLFSVILLIAGSVVLEKLIREKEEWRKFITYLLPIALSLALVLIVSHTSSAYRGLGLAPRSEDSINFFKEHNLKGPILNDYDAGSYLLFYLYPDEKVFMDNRPEAFSTKFFEETVNPMVADEKVWQEMLKKYDFNVIFFGQYDQGDNVREFIWRRVHDPEWVFVYVDQYNIILVRNLPRNMEVIQNAGITPENAPERLKYLTNSGDYEDMVTAADTFNLLGLTDLGTKVFLDIVSRWPDKPRIWMILGEWELNKTDPRSPLLAVMFLDKAISLGQRTAEAYSFLGAAYAKLSRPDNARAALLKSLSINPERVDAQKLLNVLNAK